MIQRISLEWSRSFVIVCDSNVEPRNFPFAASCQKLRDKSAGRHRWNAQ